MFCMKNDIVIKSWSELCERVYDDAWKPELGRFRSDFAFRGVASIAYKLENSFRRTCGTCCQLEYHLMRNFRKYAPSPEKVKLASDWRVLAIGQHYGLPTRLMDWTYSPFVAIHFATADVNYFDEDGAVWQIDYVKVNKQMPGPLKKVLQEVGANVFTIEMLEEAIPKLPEFDKLSRDNLLLFFEPPSVDARIINQYALFSVMSSPTTLIDDWLRTNPDCFRRLIIPKELKWEIRDKLDQANINERMLFPGLDGLADWLKRHYSPRKG